MKNSKCAEMICKVCGKDMVLDQQEPYNNLGAEIFYFHCEDNNCNGKHEVIDYSKVTDDDLCKIYHLLDNLGWFSRDYESISRDYTSIIEELEKRGIIKEEEL